MHQSEERGTQMSILSREKALNRVVSLPIHQIVPNPAQPRRRFDPKELHSLSESIRQNGLLQPITVRKNHQGIYELIAGERRLKACAMAEMEQIPAIVVDKTSREAAVLALVENLERENLNLFEEAAAIENVIYEWGVTQEEAARRLGMAQSTLANKLRLNRLTAGQKQAVLDAGLTERHARALLRLASDEDRMRAIAYIFKHQLTVAQTDRYIEALLTDVAPPRRVGIVRDVRIFINTINKALTAMKSAGILAESEQTDQGDFIEYIVRIPK